MAQLQSQEKCPDPVQPSQLPMNPGSTLCEFSVKMCGGDRQDQPPMHPSAHLNSALCGEGWILLTGWTRQPVVAHDLAEESGAGAHGSNLRLGIEFHQAEA